MKLAKKRSKKRQAPLVYGRYTPIRARRLATQARHLWRDMQSAVKDMLRLANQYDPDSLSEQRMVLRTIENILRGFSVEHRLWAGLRQAAMDRDGDDSLFRFIDEVAEVIACRLDKLEEDLVEYAAEESVFAENKVAGPALFSKIKLLRVTYLDWIEIAGLLDNIDDSNEEASNDIDEYEAVLAAIELRTRQRRNPAMIATQKTIVAALPARPKQRTRK